MMAVFWRSLYQTLPFENGSCPTDSAVGRALCGWAGARVAILGRRVFFRCDKSLDLRRQCTDVRADPWLAGTPLFQVGRRMSSCINRSLVASHSYAEGE